MVVDGSSRRVVLGSVKGKPLVRVCWVLLRHVYVYVNSILPGCAFPWLHACVFVVTCLCYMLVFPWLHMLVFPWLHASCLSIIACNVHIYMSSSLPVVTFQTCLCP